MCACEYLCAHKPVCMSACVCTYAPVLECVFVCVYTLLCSGSAGGYQPVGLAGCERPGSHGSLIMPDRLIRGESCCVSIATDRESMSPLNLSLHTGRKGVQAREEEEGARHGG